MKLSFCTKGSMRVLKTWATSGPAGSALTSTSSPAAFCAVRRDACRAAGRRRPGRPAVPAAPTPVLADTQTMGISVPSATACDDQPRQSLRRSAACPRSSRSITASSTSMIDSRSDWLISVGIDQRARGVGRRLERAGHAAEIGPLAQRHVQQHGRPCRTTPGCSSTSAGKSMLSASILLRTMIRPRPALLRLGEHPPGVHFDARLGVDHDRRRVDAPHGADRLADEVGIAGRVDHVEVLAAVVEVDHVRLDRCTCDAFLPRRSRRCWCRRRRWPGG